MLSGIRFHQRRVGGNEPEELGIAEILRAARLAMHSGSTMRSREDEFGGEGAPVPDVPRRIAATATRNTIADTGRSSSSTMAAVGGRRLVSPRRAADDLRSPCHSSAPLRISSSTRASGPRRRVACSAVPPAHRLRISAAASSAGDHGRTSAGAALAKPATGACCRRRARSDRAPRPAEDANADRSPACAAVAKAIEHRRLARAPVDACTEIGPGGKAIAGGNFPLRLGGASDADRPTPGLRTNVPWRRRAARDAVPSVTDMILPFLRKGCAACAREQEGQCVGVRRWAEPSADG
jgi:hypothetical protein